MEQKRLLVLVFAALMVLLALPYVTAWGQGQVFGSFDLAHITIPIEDLFARYQRHLELPVWTPEFQGGFPMMANGFQSFFYLPHLMLRSWLPGVWVANISLLLHAWLAATGMWLLLRTQRLSWPAAAAASLLFAGGGYFVGHVTLPHLFFPAAWLPLIWWLALRFSKAPSWRGAVAVGVAVAVQVFAGHVQMFFYTAVVLVVVAVTVLMGREKPRRLLWAAIIPVVVAVLVAVHILPIAELLPLSKRGEAVTAEEAYSVSYPVWQTLTWVQSDIFGTGDKYVGAKNEPELLLYFGWVGTVVGVLGAYQAVRRPTRLAMGALLLLAAGLALGGGEYSPLYRWLHSLPTFLSGLANPGRAMVLAHLGWCVLAGLGVERWWALSERARLGQTLVALLAVVIGGALLWRFIPPVPLAAAQTNFRWWVAVLAVLVLAATSLAPIRWRGVLLVAMVAVETIGGGWFINPRVSASAFLHPPKVAVALSSLGSAPRVYSQTTFEPAGGPSFAVGIGPRLDRHRSIEQTLVPQRAGWRGVRLGVAWATTQHQPATITLSIQDARGTVVREGSVDMARVPTDESAEIFFAPLPNADQQPYTLRVSSTAARAPQPHLLVYANTDGDFNPTGELRECVGEQSQVVAAEEAVAAADAAVTLVYEDTPVIPEREALVPIFGEGFGYHMVRGHMQMQLKSVSSYMYELGEQADFLAEKVVDHRELLNRLSVGWLVALWPEHRFLTGLPGMTLTDSVAADDRYARVYRNEQAWPRIAVASNIQMATSVDDARRQLVANQVPSDAVVLVGEAVPTEVGMSRAELSVAYDMPRALAVTVSSNSSQLLVVRDVVFPGWQAAVDGVTAPIRIVDSLFKGVVVPAGQHEVTFAYHPQPYRLGAALSGLGWLGVIGLGFYEWKRHVR